ncbi:MAG: ribonuclease P protein component, partial [Candidatus Eremiobacteraeota bacterium]|nr:ribonuclease P protein component [Candidatus Eremiobacteraeota bacterium]
MRRYDSVRGQREFALVARYGRSASRSAVSVQAYAARNAGSKVGIVITKKVGNAVVRNRLRRRCKSILDEFHREAQRYWFVIHCKPAAAQVSFATLR